MVSSTIFILTTIILLYNSTISGVNCAGVPNTKAFQNPPALDDSNVTFMTEKEFLNNFVYKFEALNTVINKMDTSIQDLQEKSHTWAIFHHHINSWNEGIRILENKLDILKRTHEEQHQQLQKLELIITGRNFNVNDPFDFLRDEVKQFFNLERKVTNEILFKINNVIRHLERPTALVNDKKSHKIANLIAPTGVASSANDLCDQRLNIILQQMAQQKDIKQLNALERRNSKNLENVNQILSEHLDKQDEIATHLQKSNECCYSLSSELTTFTESSDILLKRIEKLVRNVSEKLNDFQVSANNNHHTSETELDNDYTNEDLDVPENNTTVDETSTNSSDISPTTTLYDYDNSPDVELVRPNLNGCHELVDELMGEPRDDTRIDGIYKFSTPVVNEAERDFFERYCVFPTSSNDSGLPWTVIQRRGPYEQQENFNRSWSEYRNGFGHLSRDFWFGNEFIHRLVYHDDYELRIELEDFNGTLKWAEYSVFRLDSEKYNYNLLIGEYHGNAKDAMKYHNDNDFSTYDRRNDKTVDACCSCAMGYASGWWFDNCSEANLNGIYHYTPFGHNYIGIMWELWRGDYSLKKTRMMIRPRNFNEHFTITRSQDYNEYAEDP